MGQRDVLSIDSVDRIRFYVKKKYVDLPKEKHAEIVADAIVKIITRQLPPFSKELQDDICQQLIGDVIVAQGRPVSLEDIERISSQQVEQNELAKQQLAEWRMGHGLIEAPTVSNNQRASLADKLSAFWERQRKVIAYSVGCIVIISGVFTAQYIQQRVTAVPPTSEMATNAQANGLELLSEVEELPYNELPQHYQYQEVNHEKLKEYLATRTSLLAEPRYYDVIMETAKQFNVSPVLLFAITGQEQGFVPRDHERAEEIANNPFNVFHSWQDYNTTIEQSSQIAARTLVNLSKDRPEDIEAITWINRKYAEDPNWSNGVTSLFATISNYIND